MEINYNDWKKELETFIVATYGSVDSVRMYDTMQQNAMNMHMKEFVLRFAVGDLKERTRLIKLSNDYMNIFTKEIRG